MVNPYRSVLRTPGAVRFSFGGFVGRIPMSMLTIAVLLIVRERTGSYALAGAASAAASVTQAVVGPVFGRLVDRRSQSSVLPGLLVTFLTGIGLLTLTAALDGPTVLMFVGAVLAGAGLLPFGALVRSRWAHLLLGNDARMSTALALESVADEVVFIVGPVLVTALAVVDPILGALAAAVLATIGTVVFLAARETEPPRRPPSVGPRIRRPVGLWVVVASSILLGGVFGSVEVATIAFAQQADAGELAGVLLGLIAFGSLLAGLWYGTRVWQRDLAWRYRVSLLTLAVGGLPALFAPSVAWMAPASLIVGLSIAPTLIASSGLVARIMPEESRTEGFSWQSSSLNVGVAGGAALGGLLIEAVSVTAAFALVPVAAICASMLAAGGGRWLTERRDIHASGALAVTPTAL